MNSSVDDYSASFFRLEQQGDVAIVRFNRPSLSEEDNVELFGQELTGLVDHLGFRRLVLSLAGVGWITSSILGKLIHLHRHLKRNDGEMALCDISPNIDDVLRTSRLNSYFCIAPTVEVAVALWQNDAGPAAD